MMQPSKDQTIRIVLAQLNFIVGDLNHNVQKHIDAINIARHQLAADLIVFPELSLTGYLPEDLLLRTDFQCATDTSLQSVINHVEGDIHCLIGHPCVEDAHSVVVQDAFPDKAFYRLNQCSLIHRHTLLGKYSKQCLLNEGVFDEKRYFVSGKQPFLFTLKGLKIGVLICEDIWHMGCVDATVNCGAQVLLILNASPFEQDKHEKRTALLKKITKRHAIPIFYVNHVGGQDEIIFDGGSMAMDARSECCRFAGFFNESLCFVDLDCTTKTLSKCPYRIPSHAVERVYNALTLAVRDYVHKNKFSKALIALSGGLDSTLTCSIAVDALGAEHVYALMMPSQYTTQMSCEDAKQLATQLKFQLNVLSIESLYQECLNVLSPVRISCGVTDITEQNLQARCRAILLFALSNQENYLVLATGNRSELAMGYCTLYGDMVGGFAVLKDVFKTLVYQLALFRNTRQVVIPQRVIERAPTAELALNQKDTDTLPPYTVLDVILEAYLNQELNIDEIVAKGFDDALVRNIVKQVNKNEYKRRQGAIGPRIHHRAFGRDRRYPITNGFEVR